MLYLLIGSFPRVVLWVSYVTRYNRLQQKWAAKLIPAGFLMATEVE